MIKFLQTDLTKFFLLWFFLLQLAFVTDFICPGKIFRGLSGKKIGKNDFLQIQFKVENASNVENIAPPSFKNFIDS